MSVNVSVFHNSGDEVIQKILWGSDGNIWAQSEQFNSQTIEKMTPAGVFTSIYVGASGSTPEGFTGDGAGNWWFMYAGSNVVSHIDNAGTITNVGTFHPTSYVGTTGADYSVLTSIIAGVAGNSLIYYDTSTNTANYYGTLTYFGEQFVGAPDPAIPGPAIYWADNSPGNLVRSGIFSTPGVEHVLNVSSLAFSFCSDGTYIWCCDGINVYQVALTGTMGVINTFALPLTTSANTQIVFNPNDNFYYIAESNPTGGPILIKMDFFGTFSVVAAELYPLTQPSGGSNASNPVCMIVGGDKALYIGTIDIDTNPPSTTFQGNIVRVSFTTMKIVGII